MYATPKHVRTFLLLGLLAACGGSSSKKDATDAKSMTPDAGKVLDAGGADSKVTITDTPLAKDTIDATKMADAVDGNKITDAPADIAMDVPHDTVADVVADGIKTDGANDVVDANKADLGKSDVINKDAGDGGQADVQLPNSCSAPVSIPWDGTSQHTQITVDTTNETQDFQLSCGAGGRDLVLMFRLSAAKNLVYADTFGATWNTILQFADECPPVASTTPQAGLSPCNDDACGSTQSQAMAILPSGFHYLIISGANNEAGPVTIHLQRADISENGFKDLPTGTNIITGSNTGAGSTVLCQGAGPESFYGWISCPDYLGGELTASTCNRAAFDVVMSLQVPRADIATCANGDACGMQESISGKIPPGAGINLLGVDGDTPRDFGNFTMSYTRP